MTQSNDCDQLDAYLTDDLSVDDARRFESHLEKCSICRDTIDEQIWIDSLLQSPVRTEIERAPATILDSFRSTLHRRRRVVQTACGLAAAAVVVIAVGWLVPNRQAQRPSNSDIPDMAAAVPVRASTPVPPQATFVATTDAIVVPLESPSSEVTVVQVYPTTDTERRRQFEQSLLSASTIPNGG